MVIKRSFHNQAYNKYPLTGEGKYLKQENIQNSMNIPQLTQGEEKVYRTLLKINESSIGNILKFSGVSHSKIYDILKRLGEKGLVSTITKNGKQYFSAANPKILQNLIEEKEKQLKENKET